MAHDNRSPQNTQTLSRKSKGRSRLGCLSCRQRRVKCDEVHPRCSKCVKHSLHCRYDDVNPAKVWQNSVVTFTASADPHGDNRSICTKNSATVKISTRPISDKVVPPIYDVPISYSTGFGINDLKILANFVSATSHDILGRQELWGHDMIQLAVHNDFLMHAILMTSATHLQHLKPNCQEDYGLQATYHLHESLRYFRTALSGSIASITNNIDAIIGTSFLLIVHSWTSLKFSHDSTIPDHDPLIQHSNGCFDITRRTRRYVISLIFNPICLPRLLPARFPTKGPALDLISMVKSHSQEPDSTDASEGTYIAVIKSLTIILEAVSSHPNFGNTPPDALLVYLVQWVAFLPPKFMALLEEHDPRALIIMAYYYSTVGFILKTVRGGWWWMRERPVYMVTEIGKFLGHEWDVWMRWPIEMLEKGDHENYCGKYATETCGKYATEVCSVYPTRQRGMAGSELGILSKAELHFRKILPEE